jgi:hypothetical protein
LGPSRGGYNISPCPGDPTKWILSKTDANGQAHFWTLPWGTYPPATG